MGNGMKKRAKTIIKFMITHCDPRLIKKNYSLKTEFLFLKA